MIQTKNQIYENIYTEFYPKVLAYVYGKVSLYSDVEDITADVFLKVLSKLDTYDSKKASLSTWIYSITRNTVIDYYRKHHELISFDDEVGDIAEETNNDYDELLEKLYQGLNKLTEKQREIVILHYWYKLSHAEIAKKMNLSYSNTKKICSLALAKLRMEF